MMKKRLLLFIAPLILSANELTLSEKEITTWNIQEATSAKTQRVPLGSFIVEVTTPPSLLQTISLPFEAQVVSLDTALYEKVKRGKLLANVTGTEWISTQKAAISDAIELKHHAHTAERKNRLCKEEIIPKKECIAANAELRTDRIKVSASKALLKSYGANDTMIEALFKDLKIFPSIPLQSPIDGAIVELNAYPGKSTSPSVALFVIQKEGAFWLESDLPLSTTTLLKDNQDIVLNIGKDSYKSKVLQISPKLNQQNQTRHVRFTLPKDSKLLPGLRTNATLIVYQEAYKVPKKAVIKYDNNHIVFIKKESKFYDIAVDILGEDKKNYYLKPTKELSLPIVTTAVSVLKNMLGESDE